MIGLVVVPPLRAFQTEDTSKAVTKKAKKSAKGATGNTSFSDTNKPDKTVEKTEGTSSSTNTVKNQVYTGKIRFSIRHLSRQGQWQSLGEH